MLPLKAFLHVTGIIEVIGRVGQKQCNKRLAPLSSE
uniref:Uncharacterized protein n=1 Tax=Parascaris equorum TaxID=6256 RepID=A0A914RVQ6_PAREQ